MAVVLIKGVSTCIKAWILMLFSLYFTDGNFNAGINTYLALNPIL